MKARYGFWQEHHTIGNPRQQTIPALGNLPPLHSKCRKIIESCRKQPNQKKLFKNA